MIVHRKSVQNKHPDNTSKSSQKNRQLKRNGKGREWTKIRPSMNDNRIIDPIHIGDHRHPAKKSRHSTKERENRHQRTFHPHRLIQTVNGKRSDERRVAKEGGYTSRQ